MSFERVVCWDPSRVARVMEIEAEEAKPPIFMAVHTDEPLALARPVGRRSARDFLDEFLATEGDVRAVVIGDSGSGKSHLVHWVQLNIPERDDLRVVSVPRSGTSLRWIVERLIEELPAELQEDYRKQLVQVPDSPADFRELGLRLLTELAIALERSEPRNEVDAALAAGLRDFLLDPELRERHAGGTGIVAELVHHITRASRREEREARRHFEEADLHLEYAMTRLSDLARPTRSLLRTLQGNREHRERAVELVNAHLDAAVSQTLGISGSELTTLLNEIRRHLHGQGQQLILLVEDLVRAEGIDRALLNALIERGDDLCQLRLLIAVTTGYYERELLETQKTRMHFIINLDEREPLDEDDRLAPFAARYLNALRVDERDLELWYDEVRAGEAARPLPNGCSDCEYRPVCHAAFGSRTIEGAGEIGLYPFTPEALANMAQRTHDRSPSDAKLGPRELLRDILRPIVGDLRARAIEDGDFPDQPLLESQGGPKIRALDVQAEVRARGGPQAARYRALLELWSARPGEATRLPDDLYRAFALAPLALGETPPAPTHPQPSAGAEPPLDEPTLPEQPSIPRVVQQRLDAIETWAIGGPMTRVTNDLRGLIFRAVVTYIDWDGEGLEQAIFGGSRGTGRDSFSRPGIDFARQDTRASRAAVKLELPLDDGAEAQLQTARALQGLVNFDHFGHWGFANGLDQFLIVTEELPKWAARVVGQLRRVHDPEGEWDPVASAVEVLAIGATLASRPQQLDAPLGQRLAAMLGAWPAPDELQVRSAAWRRLYREIHSRYDELRELVLAHASSMKGGQSGSMLDAVRVVGPLRALTRDWQMRAAPPERLAEADLPDRYRRLFNLHALIREHLAEAIEDERAQRLQWLDVLRVDMPDGVEARAVVEAIEQLLAAIDANGLPVRAEALREPFADFKAVRLDDAIRMADELRSGDGATLQQLPRLASERRGNAMAAAERFLPPARQFLDNVESRILSEKEQTAGVRAVEDQFARVEAAFAELEGALESVTAES